MKHPKPQISSKQIPARGASGPSVEMGAGEPQRECGSRESGAPPSNTAPANYINDETGLQILRFGVDSLYLSYPGTLNPPV